MSHKDHFDKSNPFFRSALGFDPARVEISHGGDDWRQTGYRIANTLIASVRTGRIDNGAIGTRIEIGVDKSSPIRITLAETLSWAPGEIRLNLLSHAPHDQHLKELIAFLHHSINTPLGSGDQ